MERGGLKPRLKSQNSRSRGLQQTALTRYKEMIQAYVMPETQITSGPRRDSGVHFVANITQLCSKNSATQCYYSPMPIPAMGYNNENNRDKTHCVHEGTIRCDTSGSLRTRPGG